MQCTLFAGIDHIYTESDCYCRLKVLNSVKKSINTRKNQAEFDYFITLQLLPVSCVRSANTIIRLPNNTYKTTYEYQWETYEKHMKNTMHDWNKWVLKDRFASRQSAKQVKNYVTLKSMSLYFCLCLHFATSSERLFRVRCLFAVMMWYFSARHRLQRLVAGLYGASVVWGGLLNGRHSPKITFLN